MAKVLILAAAGFVAAHASPVRFHGIVEVREAAVRLGDVADLDGLPVSLREAARAMVLMRLRPGDRVQVRTEQVDARARALVPAIAPWLPPASGSSIVVRRVSAAAPPPPRVCARLQHDVAAGQTLAESDLAQAMPCQGVMPAKATRGGFHDGFARAGRNLVAGEVIEAPPGSALASVRPGQSLAASVTVGPVRVERRVTALQAARPGQSLFVRGDTGPAFSISLPQATP